MVFEQTLNTLSSFAIEPSLIVALGFGDSLDLVAALLAMLTGVERGTTTQRCISVGSLRVPNTFFEGLRLLPAMANMAGSLPEAMGKTRVTKRHAAPPETDRH
jgi:hypothetical protein